MYLDDTRYHLRLRLHLIKRISLWTLFIGGVLLLGLKSEHDRLQAQFFSEVDRVVRHSERTTKTLDVALEGFRQFLRQLPAADLEAVRRYTATLRQHYPELRLFGIVQAAEQAGPLASPRRLEQLGYQGLRQVSLLGQTGLVDREDSFQMPVIFTDPLIRSPQQLLTIDQAFSRAMLAHDASRSTQASHPFELLDGAAAYLLYTPVYGHRTPPPATDSPWQRAYVLLLIQAGDLLPSPLQLDKGWTLSLESQPTDTRPAERLRQWGKPVASLWLPLAAGFSTERSLSELSQPFLLRFSFRPQWQHLDLQYLGLLLSLVLVLLLVAIRTVAFSQRRSRGELEEHSSLYQQAHYDHLTGLPNANLLMDRLERSIKTLSPDQERLVLVYLDLDRFKPVNDRWGHEAGDQLLVEVARRLRQQFRMQDTVSRIHGDEFIILLLVEGTTVDHEAISSKVGQAFAAPYRVADQDLRLACSLGIAVFPDDAGELEALISAADRRMYHGKDRRGAERPIRADACAAI